MIPAIATLPVNPAYGNAIARRRVRLRNEAGMVHASINDVFHEMACRLGHDGRIVTSIEAEMFRNPTSICPTAVHGLGSLVGRALDTPRLDICGSGGARRFCTHLLDLSLLAMAHAQRPETERVYEASVPDEARAPITVEVQCNGTTVHAWQVSYGHILLPEPLAGKPLLSGFSRWVEQVFTGDALEAARVLAQTYFVAQGRRLNADQLEHRTLLRGMGMIGVCHAYQPENMVRGVYQSGNMRDFTAGIVESKSTS